MWRIDAQTGTTWLELQSQLTQRHWSLWSQCVTSSWAMADLKVNEKVVNVNRWFLKSSTTSRTICEIESPHTPEMFGRLFCRHSRRPEGGIIRDSFLSITPRTFSLLSGNIHVQGCDFEPLPNTESLVVCIFSSTWLSQSGILQTPTGTPAHPAPGDYRLNYK